ncbi:ankyrin repeat-containing domain protein [Coprinopsis sp. MPI-PUGE-AT-0042]|nr:ankyrin repeat-containing domain protein [Coprinopsis sp. MPI-PUGE-AT-0042]
MADHSDKPQTVLSQASFEGDLGTVTRLLSSGTDYLEADASGRTALHWAVAEHRLAVVEKLLAHHRHAVSPESSGDKLKRFASKIRPMGKLLGKPRSSPPMTPAQVHTLPFDELIRLSSRVRPIITPIELAAQLDDERIFKLLLENLEPFADAAVLFNGVWPVPLDPAATPHRRAVVLDSRLGQDKLDFKDGANEVGWWGKLTSFILRLAIVDGKLAVADMVLRLGADAEAGHSDGETKFKMIHLAASFQQDPAFIQLLLKHGADPNSERHNSTPTPLSFAIEACNEEVVYTLLQSGASPNAYGNSPHNSHLRQACLLFRGQLAQSDPMLPLRILRALLKAGADVNADEDLIRDVARLRNGAPLFKELVAWGANLTAHNSGPCVASCIARRALGGTAADYLAILDMFIAAYGSLSNLRGALLSRGPDYTRYSILLEFGLDADCPLEPWVFGGVVAECVEDMLPGRLGVLMESAHVVTHLPSISNSLNSLFTQHLHHKLHVTDETVDSAVEFIRILDHSGDIHPNKATQIMFEIVQEHHEYGPEIEGVVEALLDLGAGLYHPRRSVIRGRIAQHFHDIFALAAIYGQEYILACHLRRLQCQAEGKEPPFLTSPTWFQESEFILAREAHGTDVDAVLTCLKSTNHLLRAELAQAECPLVVAVKRCDVEAVRKLIRVSFGLDVNWQDKSHWTLLHVAVDEGCGEIVDILLQANTLESIDTQAHQLPQALSYSHHIYTLLSDSGLTVRHFSPLHLAAFKGNPSIVQSLLEHGANVHALTDVLVPGSTLRPAAALDFALSTSGYREDDSLRPKALHPDRLTIATMLAERGAKMSNAVARQLMELKLDEVLERFSRHHALWDMFVAGKLHDDDE